MGRLRAASCRARAASLKMSIMFLMKRKPQKNHCKSLVLIPIISDYWSNTHIYIYIPLTYIYKYYIYISHYIPIIYHLDLSDCWLSIPWNLPHHDTAGPHVALSVARDAFWPGSEVTWNGYVEAGEYTGYVGFIIKYNIAKLRLYKGNIFSQEVPQNDLGNIPKYFLRRYGWIRRVCSFQKQIDSQ